MVISNFITKDCIYPNTPFIYSSIPIDFPDLAENKDEQLACNVLNRTAKLSPWLPAFLEVLRENISEKKLKRQQRQVTFSELRTFKRMI